MTYILRLFLLLTVSTSVLSQDVSLNVLDKETNEPVPYAQVFFVDYKTGTTTDENGIFNIPDYHLKNLHIQITHVGYEMIDKTINLSTHDEQTFYLEQGHFALEEVLVSAPAGRLQGENIASVARKNIEELQRTAPLVLSEAIDNIPGVDQITTGAGIGKPVIRGLSGNRVVVYSQGIRLENQQWGDEHGLGIGEVGIESVEVIKGPASLLYGSDAMGGVLYFVDDRYAKHNSVHGFVQSAFQSNTQGLINKAGLKVNTGRLKYNVYGGYSSHADYKLQISDRVFNTRFNEKTIKGSIGLHKNNWISNVRYSFIKNNYGIVEEALLVNTSDRDFILPYQTINNHNLSIENTVYSGDSKLEFTAGYTNNYRKEYEDDIEAHALGLKLNTLTYNFKWYTPQYYRHLDFVFGSQGMVQSNLNNGEELLIPDANTNDFGVFTLGNLKYDRLQFQGGLRVDYRNIDTKQMITDERDFPALNRSFSGITFSGGAMYKLDLSKFKINLSSGFRSPNTTELLSNGIHHGENRFIIGNANLSSEKATQIDLSFDYQTDHLSFSINPFFNAIQNYIYLAPTSTIIENNPAFTYIQSDAYLYGGEAGFHFHPHKIHWMHLESNFSTVFAEDADGTSLPLIPQAKLSSTVSAETSFGDKLQLRNIFVQHIYKFQQNRTGDFEMTTDAYNLINIGLKLVMATKHPIELTTGIKNLFNTSYVDHLSRFKSLEILNPGVNFYIGLKFNLRKNLSH